MVAAYAEGQVRYGRAVQLLDEVEANALQGKAPVPPNIDVFQVPQDFQPVDEDGKPFDPGWYFWRLAEGRLPVPSGRSRRGTVPRRRRKM